MWGTQSSWVWHHATSWKVMGSIPDEVIGFFNWPSPSSCTMALGSTHPLTEMSTRNLPGDKGRPTRKADNLTAICEPTVWKMWEARHLRTLWDTTTCYRDSFTLLPFYYKCTISAIGPDTWWFRHFFLFWHMSTPFSYSLPKRVN
jgi:hypothetical protein